MRHFLLLTLLISTSVFAQDRSGNEGGNGGDVVICKNETGVLNPILLDYFEADRKMNLGPSDDAIEKVEFVLKRLERKDPVRARLYREGLKNFNKEIVFIKHSSLPEIFDEGWISPVSRSRIQKNCIKKQAVIQLAAYDYEENYESWDVVQPMRYNIDFSIWSKMDSTQQAGLILHELIVRESVNLLGSKDTQEVRELNRFWSSNSASHASQADYDYKIKKLGFKVLR